MKNEVISVLAVYYAATSDTDTRHNNYVMDITFQWSASRRNNVTTLRRLQSLCQFTRCSLVRYKVALRMIYATCNLVIILFEGFPIV